MLTSLFWKDTFERVVSTVAQVLLGIITTTGFNLVHFNVAGVVTTVGVAALAVVLKALVASQIGPAVSPASLAKDSRGI